MPDIVSFVRAFVDSLSLIPAALVMAGGAGAIVVGFVTLIRRK